MFRHILTQAQQTVLELLSRIAEVRTFYLGGGTALALHFGHRRSEDFDFFRAEELVPQDLLGVLRDAGDLSVLQEAAGTLTVRLGGVATSFFQYNYPLLKPLRGSPWGLQVADPDDIAAMKLSAVAGRGSRRDFVDLYVYVQQIAPLEQVFARFRDKYRRVTVDPYHLLRSLTFFEDAEADAMPDLLLRVTWDEIKAFFRSEATRLAREL